MLKFLSPGDVLSDAVGLADDENRVIFRMFINALVWGGVGTLTMLMLFSNSMTRTQGMVGAPHPD